MRKLVYLLIMGCFVLSIMISITVSQTNVEADMNNRVTIYVNNTEISNGNMGLTSGNEMLIPLRIVFEALGSEVIWEESTGNVYFTYADIDYVCKFVALNPNYPQQKSILVCKLENINSTNNLDYIQLNPMSGSGSYEMINDRTYLHQETGKRLFEALGCKVEFDLKNQVVNISN